MDSGVWLVELPTVSKSLILQGFLSQKTRSVTAFGYTLVVHCAGHFSELISPFQTQCFKPCLPFVVLICPASFMGFEVAFVDGGVAQLCQWTY